MTIIRQRYNKEMKVCAKRGKNAGHPHQNSNNIKDDYMATIKIKFRASASETKEGTLFYQVIHDRMARQIHIGYKLYPQEWDAVHLRVSCPDCCTESRRNYLDTVGDAVREDVKRLNSIVRRLDRTGVRYTAGNVVEAFLSPVGDNYFIIFSRNLIKQLKRIGKKRIAETYTSTVNSFERFRGDKDILLEEVDSELMMAYEAHLAASGICPNSISFYMRNLRAIYNRAVDKGLTVQRKPFRRVYTGIDKTVKRAVPLEVIRQIRDLDFSLFPVMDYARDIFMFSFYTRGMSFIDMAFLKKKDLRNDILVYRRHKTNQQLFIKWEKPMQEIIDKYDTSETPYLLPILKNDDREERKQYRYEGQRINRSLKKIGKQIGLSIPLTTYVARHGWANIAKSKNIPIATISEAMGHDSENTTRIYLASLDTSVVDQANSIILNSL